MKIALFYRLWTNSGEKFLAAARGHGIGLIPIQYGQLTLRQKKSGLEIYFEDKPLSEFKLFYLRSVGSDIEWANLLMLYAKAKNIPVVDEYLVKWGPERRLKSIAGVILGQEGIAYPKTSLVTEVDRLKRELTNYQYPLILKVSRGGRHGVGTFLVNNQSEVERVVRGRISKTGFLIQEYIPNDGDYRLVLVGYKALGAFKRQEKEKGLTLNRSAGPSQTVKKLPEMVKVEAEKATGALRVEIASVDMVINQKTNRPVIIEVNEAPEFDVFEKRTGIDVANAVVDYLKQKAAQKLS
jgi:hypothetical protein